MLLRGKAYRPGEAPAPYGKARVLAESEEKRSRRRTSTADETKLAADLKNSSNQTTDKEDPDLKVGAELSHLLPESKNMDDFVKVRWFFSF